MRASFSKDKETPGMAFLERSGKGNQRFPHPYEARSRNEPVIVRSANHQGAGCKPREVGWPQVTPEPLTGDESNASLRKPLHFLDSRAFTNSP